MSFHFTITIPTKKQTSVLHKVEELKESHYLPEPRQPIVRVPTNLPPSFPLKEPQIRTTLLDGCNKKSNPTLLKASTLETIDSYPKNIIHVYTDGSAFKATTNAGLGIVINFTNGQKKEIANPCGSFCSNNDAERMAIKNTLLHINETFEREPEQKKDIVFFTDSLTTLQKLENGTEASKDIIEKRKNIDRTMRSHDIKIFMQWIPSHIGIKGNETADQLAKQGSSLPQPQAPVSYETASRIIKTNLQEEWLNSWAMGPTGRNVYRYMSGPRPKDAVNGLKRHEQSIIFQLRTGHVPLNGYLHRIKPQQSPACPLCNEPEETVNHLLFECRALADLRERFLPKPHNVENLLYSNTHILRQTSTYFSMASGRRAEAQRPLVR